MRIIEFKISILDQFLILLYYLLLSIASRSSKVVMNLPYTVAWSPLGMILIHKFVWYRSLSKPFKTPQHVVMYLRDIFLAALIINYSIKEDSYAEMDVISHLWPCYGFIAMTFIFFAAALLLFISTACSHFTGDDDEDVPNYIANDESSSMTCSVSTGILLNTAYYLGFSVLGFMALLREDKGQGIFDLAYIVIAVASCMCAIFMISQLSSLVEWYHTKLLIPQVKNELNTFCLNASRFEIEQLEQTIMNS